MLNRLILTVALAILSVFMFGCVGNRMEHKTFDKEGNITGVTTVTNLNGFVNTETGFLHFVLKDGEFVVAILMFDRKLTDSPESARAWGDFVGNLMSGGISSTAKEALKK